MSHSPKKKNIITDYRAKTCIAFACSNGKINDDNLKKLLVSRALYCVVTKDLKILRFKKDKLEEFKLQYDSNGDQLGATFRLNDALLDDLYPFEMHYLTEIVGEYAMRDFFFVQGKELTDQYDYFVFSPITLSTSSKKKCDLLVYPTIKVEDDEIVLVEFHWFPDDKKILAEDFVDMILRASTPLSDIKFPIEYISALSLSYDKNTFEKLFFEGGNTFLASLTDISFRNVLDLASIFLSMLVKYEDYTWFSQNAITLDNSDVSESAIRLLLNGLETNTTNSRYLTRLNDFSQWKQWHIYVSGGTLLSLGDIYELSLPTSIISDQLCILNAKLQGYMTAVDEESTIKELLEVKRRLLKLRYSVQNKYNRVLMFHDIMNFAATTLFNIDHSINDVAELIDTFLEEANVMESKHNTLLQNVLASLSLLLSTSAVFEFILTPLYKLMSKGEEMPPLAQILFYMCMLLLFALAFACLWMTIKHSKHKKPK